MELKTRIAAHGASPQALAAVDQLVKPAGAALVRDEAVLRDLQRQLADAGDNPTPDLMAKLQVASSRVQSSSELHGKLTDLVARKGDTLDATTLSGMKALLDKSDPESAVALRTQIAAHGAHQQDASGLRL